MSIALLVTRRGCLEKELYPIATEVAFEVLWKPACTALGLTIVPNFPDGFLLRSEDIPTLIEELVRLREWCVVSYSLADAEFVGGRIKTLIRVLENKNENEFSELWIG